MNRLQSSNKAIKVLDLLSGLGENWHYLIRKYPNAEFTALDFSDEMIKKSRTKNLHQLGNRFKVLQQDILHNKLRTADYDKVFCAFGLKTFNESQLIILTATINRILKVDGEFSFVEISKPKNKLLYTLYSFYLGHVIPILGKFF